MKKLVFGLIAMVLFSISSHAQTTPGHHLVIVACDEWGRASKKCDGWGLCNARWFFWEENAPRKGFPLNFDCKNEEYYLNVFLDEATKEKYSNENLDSIIVDDDIILDTKSAIGKALTIRKGEYLYNKELGFYYVPSQ